VVYTGINPGSYHTNLDKISKSAFKCPFPLSFLPIQPIYTFHCHVILIEYVLLILLFIPRETFNLFHIHQFSL